MFLQIKSGNPAVPPGESLRATVLQGGAWLGSAGFVEQIMRFGRNMLLARLVAPEAFGTMAIVLSASSTIYAFTDIGVKEALIQNPKGSKPEYVGAAWWIAFGRAVAMYALLFFLAPVISAFYGNPQLIWLLRVAAISALFDGAISSRAYVAIKEMKFARWAVINHGGGICGVLITIILGVFFRDVWALVIGYCAESAARCILSYLICPYVPPLRWHQESAPELLRFSWGVLGLSFLNLIFLRTDILVLAKLYPSAELGLYALAIYLVQTPTAFIMNLLGQTLLPTFSQIQADNHRINRMLLQITSLILLLGMPGLVFVVFCGSSLLTVVYGDRYAALAAPLIVASCVALINILNGQITMIFYAAGLPQLHRRCVALMAATTLALTYPLGKHLGLAGAQLACLVSVVIGYLFQIARIRQLTGLNLSQYGKVFLFPALASLSAIAVCLGTLPFTALAQPLPNIAFGIVGCVLAYGLGLQVSLRSNQKRTG